MINYDSPRGGVSVITEKGEVTTSYLLVQRAQPADSGQYTCHPSNANTKTVLVHVLNGTYTSRENSLESVHDKVSLSPNVNTALLCGN